MTTDTLSIPLPPETETSIEKVVSDNYDLLYEIVHDCQILPFDRVSKLLEVIPHLNDIGYATYDDSAYDLCDTENIDPLRLLGIVHTLLVTIAPSPTQGILLAN